MGYFDWTANEKRQIMNSLKTLSPLERVKVRDIVKNMTASEALAHLAQGDQAATPLKAPTSPLKASEGIKQSMKADKGQNKPLKASKGRKQSIQAKTSQNATISSQDQAEKLERVQGDTSSPYHFDINAVRSDIYHYIREYLTIHDMTEADLLKAPQRVFGAVSDYVGEKVFKGEKILKSVPYDDKGPYTTNNNRYDIGKISDVLNLYYSICKEYNKAFLMDYAAGFLAVDDQTLYNLSEKLTSAGFDIFKKRESSLAAGIVDGKSSPVGALAVLNKFHNWSGASSNRTEVRETTVVYPVLVDINKNKSDFISDNSNNNT